jgi:hypothetical protein
VPQLHHDRPDAIDVVRHSFVRRIQNMHENWAVEAQLGTVVYAHRWSLGHWLVHGIAGKNRDGCRLRFVR